MANRYKGEVEFQDSNGETFVLRLGTNDFISAEKTLDGLEGRAYQRAMMHLALTCGSEKQKDLTAEDAGEILDDIGFVKFNELYARTKFGHNVDQANQFDQKQRDLALTLASNALLEKIQSARAGSQDQAVLGILDKLSADVKSRAPKEGSANP